MKIYLDTNIIDRRASKDFAKSFWNKLNKFLENNPEQICTSSLTIIELNKNKNIKHKQIGSERYSLLTKIPLADDWSRRPSRLGIARLGESGFGDSIGKVDPLYLEFQKIFRDIEDCKHLQTAIQNYCTHFLTNDKRTILNIVNNNLSGKVRDKLFSHFSIIDVDEFVNMPLPELSV